MADKKKKKVPTGDLTVNRRAWHDYAVLDKIECGIVLSGTEVKVVRNGEASLSGSYGAVLGGELYVVQMNIPVYAFGNRFNHRPEHLKRILSSMSALLQCFQVRFQVRQFCGVHPVQDCFRQRLQRAAGSIYLISECLQLRVVFQDCGGDIRSVGKRVDQVLRFRDLLFPFLRELLTFRHPDLSEQRLQLLFFSLPDKGPLCFRQAVEKVFSLSDFRGLLLISRIKRLL